jgi:hypothetical protein
MAMLKVCKIHSDFFLFFCHVSYSDVYLRLKGKGRWLARGGKVAAVLQQKLPSRLSKNPFFPKILTAQRAGQRLSESQVRRSVWRESGWGVIRMAEGRR